MRKERLDVLRGTICWNTIEWFGVLKSNRCKPNVVHKNALWKNCRKQSGCSEDGIENEGLCDQEGENLCKPKGEEVYCKKQQKKRGNEFGKTNREEQYWDNFGWKCEK